MSQLLVDLPSHARVIHPARDEYPTEYEERAFCENKNRQRDRVLEYILRQHPSQKHMRFFGLPGSRWAAERVLHAEFPREFRCVGVERVWGVLEKSLPWMPGRSRPVHSQEQMRNGSIDVVRNGSTSVLLNYELSHFLQLGRTCKRSTRHRKDYDFFYKRWTCAWYDGWSPLGGPLVKGLECSWSHFSQKAAVIPFGVTLLLGRDYDVSDYVGLPDSMSPLDRRVAVVKLALEKSGKRRFLPDDAWQYRLREKGAVMAVILGRLVLP